MSTVTRVDGPLEAIEVCLERFPRPLFSDAQLEEALGRPGAGRGVAIVYSPTRRGAEQEAARIRTEAAHRINALQEEHARKHAAEAERHAEAIMAEANTTGMMRPKASQARSAKA